MINQTLVYFNENLRNAYMKESYLQAEIEQMRLEALEAQLDYRGQGQNAKSQGQGSRNLFKATLARLTGRTTVSTTR